MVNTDPVRKRYFLSKKERLKKKAAFAYLFEHGSSFRIGILKVFYVLDYPENQPGSFCSAGFTAPKRQFKKAVDRNLLKRRMREAYRLNKHFLLSELQLKDRNLVCLFKYNARDIRSYHEIEHYMVILLRKLKKKL